MKTVKVDYGYTIERREDHYELSYKGGGLGLGYIVLLVILSFVTSVALTLAIPPLPLISSLTNGTIVLTFFGLFLVGLFYLLRARRTPRKILIFQDGVVLNNMNYEQQHIRDLYVKGPDMTRTSVQLDKSVSTGGMLGAAGVFGVVGVAAAGVGALSQAANNVGALVGGAGAAMSNSQKKKSGWSIHFDYGQKPVRVAYGLNEKQAAAMSQDLYRLIFVEF